MAIYYINKYTDSHNYAPPFMKSRICPCSCGFYKSIISGECIFLFWSSIKFDKYRNCYALESVDRVPLWHKLLHHSVDDTCKVWKPFLECTDFQDLKHHADFYFSMGSKESRKFVSCFAFIINLVT